MKATGQTKEKIKGRGDGTWEMGSVDLFKSFNQTAKQPHILNVIPLQHTIMVSTYTTNNAPQQKFEHCIPIYNTIYSNRNNKENGAMGEKVRGSGMSVNNKREENSKKNVFGKSIFFRQDAKDIYMGQVISFEFEFGYQEGPM